MKAIRFLTLVAIIGLINGCGEVSQESSHRDAAPIDKSVSSAVVAKVTNGQPHPLPQIVERHLSELQALLASGNPDNSLIASKRHELNTLHETIISAADSRAEGIDPALKVVLTPDQLATIGRYFARLDRALAAVQDSRNGEERTKAIAKAKKELDTLNRKPSEVAETTQPARTFTQDTPAKPIPQPESRIPPAYTASHQGPGNNVYAFLGNTLLAAAPDPVPAEASACTYQQEDLGLGTNSNNEDAPITPEIRQLAESLAFSPAKIYQWVSTK